MDADYPPLLRARDRCYEIVGTGPFTSRRHGCAGPTHVLDDGEHLLDEEVHQKLTLRRKSDISQRKSHNSHRLDGELASSEPGQWAEKTN